MDDLTRSIELVRLAQGGDQQALNRLFARYYDRVRRIVRMRLGPALRAQMEDNDILQDTFAAAVEAFEHFEMRDEASLINWLAKLAERKIIAAADYHAAKKRDVRREIRLESRGPYEDSSTCTHDLASSIDAPIQQAADGELKNIVEDCVAELPTEYRELILLRDYAGASWEHVAHETGRPSAEAARMMHARALVELSKNVRARGVR